MYKDKFDKDFDEIIGDFQSFRYKTEIKILNFLNSVGEHIGSYFLQKGFIHTSLKSDNSILEELGIKDNFYYDPKTKIGIKIQLPSYIDVDCSYNSLPLEIVYKVGHKFISYNRTVMYSYKYEESDAAFKRFKKYNGKAESTRMVVYLKELYPKEILMEERSQKIKNLKNKQYENQED